MLVQPELHCCLGYSWHSYKLNKLRTTSGTVLQFMAYFLYRTVTRCFSSHVPLSLSISTCLILTAHYLLNLHSGQLFRSLLPSLAIFFFPLLGFISPTARRFRLSVILPLLSCFAPYFTGLYLTRLYYPYSALLPQLYKF